MSAITKRKKLQSKDFPSNKPGMCSTEKNTINSSIDSYGETKTNSLSFGWICDKVLTYYVLSIVGLALLKYFTIISTEGFVVGMFAGFSIGLVFLGNGLIEVAKRFNHASDS